MRWTTKALPQINATPSSVRSAFIRRLRSSWVIWEASKAVMSAPIIYRNAKRRRHASPGYSTRSRTPEMRSRLMIIHSDQTLLIRYTNRLPSHTPNGTKGASQISFNSVEKSNNPA
jgi:hypothetical protein